MPRTILLVDDSDLDLRLMLGFLKEQYDIITARSGREMMTVLDERARGISAVVLDLIMPEMDGYEALRLMKEDEVFRRIPVIVTSGLADEESRARAARLGANGYITKPVEREFLLCTLRNTIDLREKSALSNMMRLDPLTGIPNRSSFFEDIERMIMRREPGYYNLACIDIENFKVINDQYGVEQGDAVLKNVASALEQACQAMGGACCRYSADKFGMLYPAELKEAQTLVRLHEKELFGGASGHSIKVRVGRYRIDDLTIPVSAMYDRATLAEESIRGRYDCYVAEYDDSMRQKLLREQRIVNEMDKALARGEFVPWLQPQFNHATGAMIGAEALVRWKRDGVFVSPVEFVPVFERNGFIYELDQYIWERVCALLRHWLDEGRVPLPVSVNISRRDLFHPDFIDVITGLIRKYNLPYRLLRLEVTESAFAESTGQIVARVNQLIALGFTVEIDDFGSGYSSLNTLKDVPAQILKLDMKFFENTQNQQRGGNIIESVVRMAKWLGMAVIAEGVEDVAQADYLKTIGCYYIQGYCYAKPMPVEDYEKLLFQNEAEPELTRLKTIKTLDNSEFWNPKSIETLIFNSYVGGACIFEYNTASGKTELLRVNEQYGAELGAFAPDNALSDGTSPLRYLDTDGKRRVFEAIRTAIAAEKETAVEARLLNSETGETGYFRLTLRVIAAAGERKLFYCIIINMTEQRQAEQKRLDAEEKQRESAQRLEIIMKNAGNGITATALYGDRAELLFANDKFYELLCCTAEEYAQMTAKDMLSPIYPEDRESLRRLVMSTNAGHASARVEFRVTRRDGKTVWLRTIITITSLAGVDAPVQIALFSDVTAEKEAREQLQFLNATAHDILAQPDSDAGIEATLNKLIRYFEGDRAYVVELDYERRVSCNTYEVCAPGVTSEIDNLQGIPFDVTATWFERLGRNEHMNIESVEEIDDSETELREILSAQGIHSLVLAPLFRDGVLMGYVGIDNPARAANQIDRLTALSDYIAILLTRRDLTRGLEKAGREIDSYSVSHDEMNFELNTLLNVIPSGVVKYSADESAQFAYISRSFAEALGYTPESFRERFNNCFNDMIYIEDREKALSEINTQESGGEVGRLEYRVEAADGSLRWFHDEGRRVTDRNGKSWYYVTLVDVTDTVLAQERLRVSEELGRLAIEHSGRIITRFDVRERTLSIPASINKMFELPPVLYNMPGEQIELGRVSPETAQAYTDLFESIASGSPSGHAAFQQYSSEGWRWLKAQYTTVFSDTGKPVSAVITFADITEKLEKEAVYNKWQQSLKDRPEASYTLFRCNMNRTPCQDSREGGLFPMYFGDEMTFDERTEQYANELVVPEDRDKYKAFLSADTMLAEYYRGHRSHPLEYRELTRSGCRWIRLSADLVEYPNSREVEAYLMFEDIDEAKRAELLTQKLSETDPLTGVFNRTAFVSRMEEGLTAGAGGSLHALLMLDIDHFKSINDTFGHREGDEVLKSFTEKISSVLRKSDLIGRLGGDEFVVFLHDLPDKEVAKGKAQQLCSLGLTTPDGTPVTVSIGIALCPGDGDDFEALYKKADAALYAVKERGRNGCEFA